MGALPVPAEDARKLPDYLPARMLNESAYCPRLFYYEWVEGLFAESADTVQGAVEHGRVDAKAMPLPESSELPEKIHARSVTLTSERLRIIATIDLVQAEGGTVTPLEIQSRLLARVVEGEIGEYPVFVTR